MMHQLPSLENEDPRLTYIFSKMRPPNMPKYGLGYLEQMDYLIPQSRFCSLPEDCKKPSVTEIHKLFTLMNGCKNHKVDTKWMK